MKLRVAFPYKKPVDHYDPAKIHFGPEYIFLENIYSPLIELSTQNGKAISGVAEEFFWNEQNEFVLKIRKDLKTIDGYQITAHDAEVSLKRLLIMSGNTHGNFKDIICSDVKLDNIEDECEGIEVRNDFELILKPNGKKPFLTHMLTAIDFAVIPKPSIDPKSLEIIDYRNTSGPYYVETSDSDGVVQLKINPSHYHYSEKLSKEIEIVPSGVEGTKSSKELFLENKVDHITTIDKLNPEEIVELYKKSSDSVLHTTMNIRTFAVFFTERGIKEFSTNERIAYGKAIKEALLKYYLNKTSYQERDQFFPPFGDGHLEKEQLTSLSQKIRDVSSKKDGSNFKLSLLRVGKLSSYKPLLEKNLPKIHVYEGNKVPTLSKYEKVEDMPHAFIGGPDITFNEDISLITYSMNVGLFGMSKKERQNWISEYMDILDKSKRLENLQKLHFQALNDAVIYPIASSPYVALIRKPWKSNLPQIFANNPIWTITKN